MKINDVLSIGSGNGINTTTSGTSQEFAMPAPNQGPLRYVSVTCTGPAFILFGFTGDTCTTSDFMLDDVEAYLFVVSGYTHFHILQVSGAVGLSVYPLENG